ncbi:hypothetical protein COT64_00315 [Candidatus Shapirobacteria bacterium CG09_land_8_20_14_0_10_39_12]|uniref:Uncharacterized protein n=1 Tax=Candidatus Shapirobacteria bacterium CG09_land_8_20_14_0_10_39_12 TaxID=1974885 RepID=A0A2H0WQE5_9BACT|nr:MAG: hypothetical protein COT64_00315 [Candidatus Shapirobacteria bacterium CG09_land_8_20_14_0_10_39_12]
MLPKKNRLNRTEIEGLKSQKRNILQGRFFGLVFQKNPREKKFALIISKKTVAKATGRNKIKRLLYKSIENNLFNIEGKFLFLAKKNCVTGKSEDFEKEMIFFKNIIKGY